MCRLPLVSWLTFLKAPGLVFLGSFLANDVDFPSFQSEHLLPTEALGLAVESPSLIKPCPFCCSAHSVIKWVLAHNSIRKVPPPQLLICLLGLNTFSSPDTHRASVNLTKASSVEVSASIDFQLLRPPESLALPFVHLWLTPWILLSQYYVLSMRMTPLEFGLLLSLNLPGTKSVLWNLTMVQWGHFLSGILCCLSVSSEYLSLKPGFPTSWELPSSSLFPIDLWDRDKPPL